MKLITNIFAIATLLFATSCNRELKTEQNTTQPTAQVDSVNPELSYEAEIEDSVKLVIDEKMDPNTGNTKRGGNHPISLQWISWDKPGTAKITPLENEWYSISGRQENDGDGYLSIEGKIKRISEKELEFEGTIITKISSNNGGEPCIKTGKQTFYGKGERKYFRLQNMTNCEGGMLVDYVDIYPGNSSL